MKIRPIITVIFVLFLGISGTKAEAQIIAELDTDICFHKKYPDWKNGNPIHLWDCNQGPDENKTWVYDSDTGYIRAKSNPSKCFHKKYPDWKNGNPIHLWDCNQGPDENKTWVYEPDTGYIRAKFNRSMCFHKKYPDWKNGNPIHLWDCNQGPDENKTWNISGTEDQLKWQYDQINSAVAYNSQDDDFMMVYEDHHWGGEYHSDICGFLLRSNRKIDIAYKGPQKRKTPDIVFNSNEKEFLVVWTEENPDFGNLTDVKARRFDRSGRPIGEEIWVTSDFDQQANPKLAFNVSLNEYYLVFEQWGFESDLYIYGLRLASDGQPIDEPSIMICRSCNSPDVAYDSLDGYRGRYLIVWSDISDIYNPDIYGLFVEEEGAIIDDDFAIETREYAQLSPKVTSGEGELFVVWEDHHWGEGEDSDIVGRRINHNGSLIGARVDIAYKSKNSERRYAPEVVYSGFPHNAYFVVYEIQDGKYPGWLGIYICNIAGRSIDKQGKLGPEEQFGRNAWYRRIGQERMPSIAVGKQRRWQYGLTKYSRKQVFMAYSRKYWAQSDVDKDKETKYLDFDIWYDSDIVAFDTIKTEKAKPSIKSFYRDPEPDPKNKAYRIGDTVTLRWDVECPEDCTVSLYELNGEKFTNLPLRGSHKVVGEFQDNLYKLIVKGSGTSVEKTASIQTWPKTSGNQSPLTLYYFKVKCPSVVTPCTVVQKEGFDREGAKKAVWNEFANCSEPTEITQSEYFKGCP